MSVLKELKEMITARGGNAGSANTVAQAVDVLTDLGGGSESSSYVVTLTSTIIGVSDGPTFEMSIDKTFEEITNAYNNGSQVLLQFHYEVADGVDVDLDDMGLSDFVEKVWTADDSAIMCQPHVQYYVSGYKEYQMKVDATILWYNGTKLETTQVYIADTTINVD